jgi:predicted transcriptional regulator
MAITKRAKQIRRSVSLSAEVHRKVERLAQQQKRSSSRVLERLVEKGLTAEESERQQFFDLAERFRAAEDPDERQRLGDELGRMVFGE